METHIYAYINKYKLYAEMYMSFHAVIFSRRYNFCRKNKVSLSSKRRFPKLSLESIHRYWSWVYLLLLTNVWNTVSMWSLFIYSFFFIILEISFRLLVGWGKREVEELPKVAFIVKYRVNNVNSSKASHHDNGISIAFL